MRIGFLITARLRSTRLPRKLLLPLDGTTVIGKVIERAKRVGGLQQVVLCTSDLEGDDELATIAANHGIACFRGSPEDVLVRLRDCCVQEGYAGFVGITGENPLFHSGHCEQAHALLEDGADLVRFNGMPIGCAPYGVGLAALKTICALKEEMDTEIWGYLLNRPEIFDVRTVDVEGKYALPGIRLTIDYPEDFALMEAVFAQLPGQPPLDKVIELLKEQAHLLEINAQRVQADLPDTTKHRLDRFFSENADRIRTLLGNNRVA